MDSVGWVLNIGIILLTLTVFSIPTVILRMPFYCVIAYPLGVMITSVYILWRSALRITLTQKVTWRGTSYSLKEIKQKHVKTKLF